MHRLFLAFSLCTLAASLVLTGCTQSDKPGALAQDKPDKVSPGESKPIPSGELKPNPKGEDDPESPALTETKTDPDTLPVLPTLSAPTGAEKYEASLSRAFLLMAEGRDKEALDSLNEARAAQETDFVKTEIERLEARVTRNEAALRAADAIKDVIDAGKGAEASKLAADALARYGDSDLAEKFSGLKRQADVLISVSLEDKARGERFLREADAARKDNNVRAAVLAYEQAVATGADVSAVKDTYEAMRAKLQAYDDNRAKAAELRKEPLLLEQAVTVLKVAAESWDTPQVRQEISEAELAINNRKDRVAVADFEVINDIGIPRAGHAIAEELVGHFRPRFDVVERSMVQAVLTGMKLEHGELAVNETARTEFGKLAKARYVVLGSVNRLSGIHVNARLVDTQTGLVAQTARIVATSPEEMTNRLPALARMLQMTDDEKRSYERQLAEQAKPVAPPPPAAAIPPPPQPPAPEVAPPAPVVVFTPRPPDFGRVVAADFDGFRVVDVAAPPPPPVVVVEAPPVVRDRAFFVAVEVGDNLFRRGEFRAALRHFEFALALNPGHADIRLRVMQCQPLCPPPVVVVQTRPRLVVLPFAEFHDPFAVPSSIPQGLGIWTADAIAPYFAGTYDVVDRGEVFWWMGRLGLSMRDVLTNPEARLCLGRALGARYFLMGSLREVASFDVTTHVIDAELNAQTLGARIRVNNAAELRFRLAELAQLTLLPPAQQVVVIQQQQVVQQKVVAAQLEFRKGNFAVSLGFFKEVLVANPNNIEARQMLVQIEYRQRQANLEAAQVAAWQQQQAGLQAERERQIAFVAAAQGAQEQARRDMQMFNEVQRQQLLRQQALAQQQLLAQAAAAQQQRNLALQAALLENAAAVQRNQNAMRQALDARAALLAQRQQQVAAAVQQRQNEIAQARDAQIARVQTAVAAEQLRRKEAADALATTVNARVKAEYDAFVALGDKAMAARNFPGAAAAYQNAARLKPSPEIQKLAANALLEQAKAEAALKGAEQKAKLEAQLADEMIKQKQQETKNAELQIKYQETMNKAKLAAANLQFEQAVASYRLAMLTMQTDEAATGLKHAQAELAKAKTKDDAEASKKAEAERKQAALEKKLVEAKAALDAKQFDKAVTTYKVAVTLKPGDVEVQKLLSQAELARDDAAAEARKQKDTAEKQGSLTKLLAAGDQNLKAKRYDAAIVSFTDALVIAPDNRDAKAGLASAHSAQKEAVTDAAALAEAKKKREDYEKAMRQGRAALGLKQYADALGFFQKAQDFLPGDAASAELIKDVSKQKAEAETASAVRQKATEVSQAIADARAALRENKFDEAKAATDKALKLDADNAVAKKLANNIDEARKAYAAAIQKKDDAKKSARVDDLVARARRAIQAKDLDGAAKFVADAAAVDATDPDVKKVQTELDAARRQTIATDTDAKQKQAAYLQALRDASTAFAAKKYDVAIREAKEALANKPGDAAAAKILADAQKAQEAASSAATEAAKTREAYDAAIQAGRTAYASRKFDEAAKAFADALKAIPGDPTATQYLNTAKKAAAAVDAAATEAQKKKDAYDAAMKAGRTAMARKDYDEAIKSFNDALKADPGDPTATALLKQAKDAQGETAADAKKKQLYDAWMAQADKMMAARNYDEAASAFSTALRVIPGDPAATKGLAEARTAMSKKEPAIVEPKPKDPSKKDPPPKGDPNAAKVAALLKQAGGEEDAGKYAEAYQTYQDVLALAPGNAEAKKRSTFCQWMDQGKRQLAAGKLSEAASSFEQALKIDPNDANAKDLLNQAKPKPKAKKK